MELTEVFVPVKDFPEYEVSNYGVVRRKRKGLRIIEYKTLRPRNSSGYQLISLCDGKVVKSFSVHRLVAEAFIPNPENKRTVNHIDGVRHNNLISNLEWNTHSENTLHSIRVLGNRPRSRAKKKNTSAIL